MKFRPVSKFIFALLTAMLWLSLSSNVEAQLFGKRAFGSSLSRGGGRGSSKGVGQVTGSERFVRGNRRGRSFIGVGSKTVGGKQQLVGVRQTGPTARVRPATDDLRNQRKNNRRTNRRRPKRRPKQLDEPRLEIGFDYSNRVPQKIQKVLDVRLRRISLPDGKGSIKVTVSQRTARLQGKVLSNHARKLAEALVLLEPGIEAVQNELVVGR